MVGYGLARLGSARQGFDRYSKVGFGKVGQGLAGYGRARQGFDRIYGQVRFGVVWYGKVRRGMDLFERSEERRQLVATLVGLFLDMPRGEVISYKQMSEALGFNVLERRDLVQTADQVLQSEYSRALENVRDQGYRMVFVHEHPRLVAKEVRRAQNAIERGLQVNTAMDVAELSADQRVSKDRMATHLMRMSEALESNRQAHAREKRLFGLVTEDQDLLAEQQRSRLDELLEEAGQTMDRTRGR